MTTAPPTTSISLESQSLFQSLLDKLEFSKAAQEWSRCVSGLRSWEEEHLLVDHPSVLTLSEHRRLIERLMQFGQLCSFVASYPDFENDDTAEMIHATQLVLKDKLRMWHGPKMSPEESNKLLAAAFPEP